MSFLNNAGSCVFVTRNKEHSQTSCASVSIWSNYRMWVAPSLQKAIWLSSTFLPGGNKIDVSLGKCMLPRELSTVQETHLLQMCPLVWGGQAAQEVQFSLHKQGARNTMPGSCKYANPARGLQSQLVFWYAVFFNHVTVLLFQRGNSQLLILLIYLGTELGKGTWTTVR